MVDIGRRDSRVRYAAMADDRIGRAPKVHYSPTIFVAPATVVTDAIYRQSFP
jgi:hypothetical protein